MAFLSENWLRLAPIGPNWPSIGPEQALSAPNWPGRVPESGQLGELRVRRGIGDPALPLPAVWVGAGRREVHKYQDSTRLADALVARQNIQNGETQQAEYSRPY